MAEIEQVSDADRAAIVAYVDRDMEPAAAEDFERRLASDPRLARAFATFVRVDSVRARACRTSAAPRATEARRWRVAALAAAGLAAAVGLGFWLVRREQPAPAIQVAILRGAPDRDGYHAVLGLPDDLIPPGGTPRGQDPSGRTMSVGDYVAMAREVEQQRIAAALARPAEMLEAFTFYVPVRLTHRAWIAVLALYDDGRLVQLFPPAGASPETGWLSAPATHILPREALVPRAAAQEPPDFEPGFLLPRGVKESYVVVIQSQAAQPDLLERLTDALSPPRTRGTVLAWLRAQGFSARSFVVRAPQ